MKCPHVARTIDPYPRYFELIKTTGDSYSLVTHSHLPTHANLPELGLLWQVSWLSSAQPGFRMSSYSHAPSIRRRWQPQTAAATDDTDGPQQLLKITDGCKGVVPAVKLVLESDVQCPAPTQTPEADEGTTCMCPFDSTSYREAIYDQGKTGPTFKWVRPYGAPPPTDPPITPIDVRHPNRRRARWLSQSEANQQSESLSEASTQHGQVFRARQHRVEA
jgi:hypothetical protein